MNLEDFITAEKDRLDVFLNSMLQAHKARPVDYPIDLPEGDWIEQYMMWCDDENKFE